MSTQDRLAVMAQLLGPLDRLNELGGLIIEDELGWQFSLVRVWAVGARTDDPGLVLKIAHLDSQP